MIVEILAAWIMQQCKAKIPPPRTEEQYLACFDDEVNKLKFNKKGEVILPGEKRGE